jgi:lambda repressor-like predicted transcriptional regulator
MAVARRADPQDFEYPITEEWVRDVKAKLSERGAQAKLCREIGCSPSTLNELLSFGIKSTLVPRISKVLGVPPTMMIVSRDTHEIVAVVEKMGEQGRRVMREIKALDKAQRDLMLAMIAQMAKNKDQDE